MSGATQEITAESRTETIGTKIGKTDKQKLEAVAKFDFPDGGVSELLWHMSVKQALERHDEIKSAVPPLQLQGAGV